LFTRTVAVDLSNGSATFELVEDGTDFDTIGDGWFNMAFNDGATWRNLLYFNLRYIWNGAEYGYRPAELDFPALFNSERALDMIAATNQPKPIKAIAGKSARFFFETNYGCLAAYQWYIAATAGTSGTAISGATSTKLALTDAKAADAGYYYCVATAVDGQTIESADAQLEIVPAEE
jgi:hypothetical protein